MKIEEAMKKVRRRFTAKISKFSYDSEAYRFVFYDNIILNVRKSGFSFFEASSSFAILSSEGSNSIDEYKELYELAKKKYEELVEKRLEEL